jgi:uncharacterized membrane protein
MTCAKNAAVNPELIGRLDLRSRPKNPRKFLTPDETEKVIRAIAEAEEQTSAEIKFVIVRHCWGDIRTKAASVFRKMDLHQTALRNCALIMLVTTNREFLIYGDQGIHEKTGQNFWNEARDAMLARFKEHDFAGGLIDGIVRVGRALGQHFPHQSGDVNEISDQVAYEE